MKLWEQASSHITLNDDMDALIDVVDPIKVHETCIMACVLVCEESEHLGAAADYKYMRSSQEGRVNLVM